MRATLIGTTPGFNIMSDIIISLFEDESLMDVATSAESIMEILPSCYAVEFDGKTYYIDDDYFMRNNANAKELNIKFLVYDSDVLIEKVGI